MQNICFQETHLNIKMNGWALGPALPDFLPVMGPSKNHKNIVLLSFGHHHLGWTLGPISGKIISGMIAEGKYKFRLISAYSSLRDLARGTCDHIKIIVAYIFPFFSNFILVR